MRLEKRPATEVDIPFLLALRIETMNVHLVAAGASISEEQQLDRVMYCFDCAEVLTDRGEPAGLLKVKRQPRVWEIIQIQLSSQLQGKGVGRSLLEDTNAGATTVGADVKLNVLKANPARHLYERLGFKIIREDVHEYNMHRAG